MSYISRGIKRVLKSINILPKSSSDTGDIVIERNVAGWDSLEIRKKGNSGGGNFTSVDVSSYPEDDSDDLDEAVTDSAVVAKRIDTSGNTELVGLFSNGYPAGMGDSQIHGIEVQAYGDPAKASIRDFVFLYKDKTTGEDGLQHIYREDKLEDDTDRKTITHIPQENLVPLHMTAHGFAVNDAVAVVGTEYYKTHAGETHANNHNYIGIVRKVVDADNFEIAMEGSVVDRIVGNSGDTVYMNTGWGTLTTTAPTAPDAIIQVGINISANKMLLRWKN